VKRGVVPGWYQFCGDESRSVTSPAAHAGAGPEAGDAATLWCRDDAGLERGEGVGRADAWARCTCPGVEPADFVTAERAACAAVGRAASIPFAAQLTVASNPIPTARTATRRRQYVACETAAGWRRGPRGWAALPRGLRSIPLTMEGNHQMSLKARRPGPPV
jgi:hypothetical protein